MKTRLALRSVSCVFAILFLGEFTSTAGKLGYFQALLRTWDVEIPATSWPMIVSSGALTFCVLIVLLLLIFRLRPQTKISLMGSFVLFGGTVWLTIFMSYTAGRIAAYIFGDLQQVDIIGLNGNRDLQDAIFYRSYMNDAVGVILNPVTHTMTREHFATPIIKGRLNCDPIRIRLARYSEIR